MLLAIRTSFFSCPQFFYEKIPFICEHYHSPEVQDLPKFIQGGSGSRLDPLMRALKKSLFVNKGVDLRFRHSLSVGNASASSCPQDVGRIGVVTGRDVLSRSSLMSPAGSSAVAFPTGVSCPSLQSSKM